MTQSYIKKPYITCYETLLSIQQHQVAGSPNKWVQGMLKHWLDRLIEVSKNPEAYAFMGEQLPKEVLLMIRKFCKEHKGNVKMNYLIKQLCKYRYVKGVVCKG